MVYEEDATTGLFEWIGQALDSPGFLKTRLAFGVVVGLAATALFTHILLRMERHNSIYKAAVMEAAVGERDTQLELEEDQSSNNNGGDYVQADLDGGSPTRMASSPKYSNNGESSSDSIYKPGDSRRRLSWNQRVQIFAHVTVLILFNYLLLVFLPGSVLLSFLAMTAVWILALHSYLRDELRRSRYDRLFTMIALFFIIAGCLTLVTYCRLALNEGRIYEGPARIVGYDDAVYNNKDGQTMRADLQVAWGYEWGCPDEGGKVCEATVQGALCETKYKPVGYADADADSNETEAPASAPGNRRRRRLETTNIVQAAEEYEEEQDRGEEEDLKDELEATVDQDLQANATKTVIAQDVADVAEETLDEDEEEIEEEASEDIDEVINEADEEITEVSDQLNEEVEVEQVLQTEVVELEGGPGGNTTVAAIEGALVGQVDSEAAEVEQLEADKDALEEQNEELQQDLADEEDYEGELEGEIEDLEDGKYVYDDTVFEDDDYWQQDWDSVWGDYACEDLFDADLEGETYDPALEPGQDQWPTVTIYGSCNSCQAYVQDYYSTEHFQSIRLYELQSWVYLMLGFFLLCISAVAALAERIRPTTEKTRVLLSHEGGVLA